MGINLLYWIYRVVQNFDLSRMVLLNELPNGSGPQRDSPESKLCLKIQL